MGKLTFLIKQNLLFFIGFLVFILAGSILLIAEGNHPSFLLLNSHHYSLFNIFFEYYTNLGNGVFVIFLGVLYIFGIKKKDEGIALLSSFLLSGLVAQIVKHFVNFPRPKSFFGNSEPAYFIQGINFAYNNSFPSGHAATAFAAATVIVLMMKNKKWQLPVLLLAMLVGFSRIYLGQHFLLDVVAGAIVGVVSGLICVYVIQHYQERKIISVN